MPELTVGPANGDHRPALAPQQKKNVPHLHGREGATDAVRPAIPRVS